MSRYLSFGVLSRHLAEAFVGQLKDFGKVSRFDCGLALFLRKETNLSKVLVLPQISDVSLSLLVKDGNKAGDNKVHSATHISFL
jgi:hypothetical protein